MYWDNPLLECCWPHDPDPIPGLLGDQHLLFWNPAFDFRDLRTNQRLSDLCSWANHGLNQGTKNFVNDPRNHYDIANLVKLNIWASDIQRQGMVKPWLILDWGNGHQEAGTGDSRLRLCEAMPEIQSVKAFVSTHRDRAHLYKDLEPVQDIHRLAELCLADHGQNFLFRGTDRNAPFGIYWYEFDSARTRSVTPSQDWCIGVFQKYCETTQIEITTQWFLNAVDWAQFDKTMPAS